MANLRNSLARAATLLAASLGMMQAENASARLCVDPTVAPEVPPEVRAPELRPVVDAMERDAKALSEVFTSSLAQEFLGQVGKLQEPGSTKLYISADRSVALSERAWAEALAKGDRFEDVSPRSFPAPFYYNTMYGSPLVFGRLLDVASMHGARSHRKVPGSASDPPASREPAPDGAAPSGSGSLRGLRVMDFGCGTIGHLRLIALASGDAHGVDVDPILRALYDASPDIGPIDASSPESSRVSLTIGRWPASDEARASVGGGYDLITSKNTLKAGYIAPKPPEGQSVDPRTLIDLGVSGEGFLAAMLEALKPGGLVVIYNISPAQNPAKYIPWADGGSPWTREQYERAGFQVLALDVSDDAVLHAAWEALKYDEGKGKDGLGGVVMSLYTVLRRPEQNEAPNDIQNEALGK
ncbi:MAG: hypothetical protein SFZ23_12885 [Planctomycetota bacterium]|nr:hypothetical protein [Planctomycetota bacterium]